MLDQAANFRQAIIELRRKIHQYPEVGGEETRTAALVAEHLRRLGLEVRHPQGTSVLGVLRGQTSGPAVLLRAELDALPIQEVPGRPYGSQVEGVMHACGHDGHMAILVGTAAVLARERHGLRGEAWFLFQPAEEKLPEGGARALLEAGILAGSPVELAIGLHLWPDLPAGTVGLHTGPVMAAGDIFQVTFTGDGGHAAQPHAASDTVASACHTAVALPGLVRRRVNAVLPVVVSVGMVHGGRSPNVLPTEASLAGTTRYFESPLAAVLRDQVTAAAAAVAGLHGCRAQVDYRRGYPEVVNDAAAAEQLARAAAQVLGEKALRADLPPSMLADDFSYLGREVPSCYFWLGAATPGRQVSLHSPDFDFEEEALVYGTAILSRVCLNKLSGKGGL